MKTFRELEDINHQWVEDMKWHNKLPLEYLALIGSEVGECVNECRGTEPTPHLAEELADVILRTSDFAKVLGIDLLTEMEKKLNKNLKNGIKKGRLK